MGFYLCCFLYKCICSWELNWASSHADVCWLYPLWKSCHCSTGCHREQWKRYCRYRIFLKNLYLLRSRNLPLLWNPLRTAVLTKPRLWLNLTAAESSPHLYAPHFQDSDTALLPYLRVVHHGGLFPYWVRLKFCTYNPPICISHYGTHLM